MEEPCSTGQSPQWAVVPMEEKEEEEFILTPLRQADSDPKRLRKAALPPGRVPPAAPIPPPPPCLHCYMIGFHALLVFINVIISHSFPVIKL